MSSEQKFEDARAAMKDLARKVETIDLSGTGLLGGKRKVRKAKKAKSPSKKSTSPKKTKRSSASKSKSRSKPRKSSATKKSRKSSASKKTAMSINEHKLADNLIQLGVQLKNMQLDGGKRRKTKKSPTRLH